MSRSRVVRFGPGSLESVELRLWAKNRSYGSVICAEIRGSYTVHCGAGNTHTVRVDGARECASRAGVAEQRAAGYSGVGDGILAAYDEQSTDDAFDVAYELVTVYALEDWTDPCET